jgi:hypothetical protein
MWLEVLEMLCAVTGAVVAQQPRLRVFSHASVSGYGIQPSLMISLATLKHSTRVNNRSSVCNNFRPVTFLQRLLSMVLCLCSDHRYLAF